MSQLKERTREHYDSLLKELEESYLDYRWRDQPQQRLHYAQTRRSLRRALKQFIPRVGRMLEVGCGPGTWTGECLEHAEHLTLLDISREMLKEAKGRYANDGRVSLICGDFTSGIIGDDSGLGAIVSVRAIEYMTPKSEVIQQVGRLLAPGGTFLVITKNPAWRDAKTGTGFAERDSDSIHSDWIYWAELSRLLRDEGFQVATVRPAAMGSYHPPFANPVGRRACHVLHRFVSGFEMSTHLDPLTESYLLAARQPVDVEQR